MTGFLLREKTFEWLTLLDAVLEADERLVMVEAGASYGRRLAGATSLVGARRLRY